MLKHRSPIPIIRRERPPIRPSPHTRLGSLQNDRFDSKDVTWGDYTWFIVLYPNYMRQCRLEIAAEGRGNIEDALWNTTHGGQ